MPRPSQLLHVFGVTGTIGLTRESDKVNLNIVSDDETSNVYLTKEQCLELAKKLQQIAAQLELRARQT